MSEDHNDLMKKIFNDINERLIEFKFENGSNDHLDLSKSGSDEVVREKSIENLSWSSNAYKSKESSTSNSSFTS